MLTTAQQKVKQELEELQINALVYHNEKTIIPRKNEQNMMTNLEDPKHSEQQLNKYLIELSVKQELAVESLTKGFEKEKIKYLLRENGTIQYWIKSKSYGIEK